MTPQQTYRSRRAAYAEFISKQGISISESKFYTDCQKIPGMVKLDKSVELADLVAYIERERAKSPGIARGLGEITLEAKKADADYRKALADAQKAEIQVEEMQRALDKKWILREEADLETCTWACLTRDNIGHRLTQALPAIIHLATGDLARMPEVQAIIDQAIADACNDIANSGEVTVEIEEEH